MPYTIAVIELNASLVVLINPFNATSSGLLGS